MQRLPIINPLLIEPSSDILDGEFDDDILDTLVLNLVPNLDKLGLLSRKV